MTTDRTVAVLLEKHGRPYAEEAGIRLADKPGPLYQLLVLATLLSARISADIAMAAAGELFAAGYRSPKAIIEACWQDRLDALGRGHYRRYDERTATMLGDGAGLLIDRWHGDLRHLRDEAGGEPQAGIARLLTEFPGIGPARASIFLREVQGVWLGVAPYVDALMMKGASKVGPARSARRAEEDAVSQRRASTRLAAALVRVALSGRAAGEVTAAMSGQGAR